MGYWDILSWWSTPAKDVKVVDVELTPITTNYVGAARNLPGTLMDCPIIIKKLELDEAIARLRPVPQNLAPKTQLVDPLLTEIRAVLYKRNLKHFENMLNFYTLQ